MQGAGWLPGWVVLQVSHSGEKVEADWGAEEGPRTLLGLLG